MYSWQPKHCESARVVECTSQSVCHETERGCRGSRVVVGKFSLFNHDALVFFDPGSTHSYICFALACYDNVDCIKMTYDVLVASPLG